MVGDSIVYPTNQPWPLYKLHSLSFCRFIAFNDILLSKICSLMVCRNICDRLYSKVVFGISNYSLGQKYCRRCEAYTYNDSIFCPCCRMQLRHQVVGGVKKYLEREKLSIQNGRWLMDQHSILSNEIKSWE